MCPAHHPCRSRPGAHPRGAKGRALEHLAQTLRSLPTPVLGRITQDAFVLDVRTLADAESLLTALGDHPLAP